MTSRHPNHLTRRQFLGLSGASLAALVSGLAARWPDAAPGFAQEADAVVPQVHVHSYDPAATTPTAAVRAAMLDATDLSWLNAGDSVFVKLAANSNYAPPSVTSPDVVEGVVTLLQEAGAGEVFVGDMSGAQFVRHLPDETIGSTRENMRTSGLLQAAEATGATIHCFEEVPYPEAYILGVPDVESPTWGADLQVAEVLDRVDHVINLPRLGKHVLAGASLGLKNAIGWISDYSRMVLHRDGASFHQRVAEVNAIPQLKDKMRLTLTLVDQALTTYGPDAGYHLPLAQPLIIASNDVVSHDQVALLALLWGREQTPAAALDADPWPAESNGLNWWFVRVTWGESAAAAYQDLPTYAELASPAALHHVNLAYNILHGGRPARVEVIPGGVPRADTLFVALTGQPGLGIAIGGVD